MPRRIAQVASRDVNLPVPAASVGNFIVTASALENVGRMNRRKNKTPVCGKCRVKLLVRFGPKTDIDWLRGPLTELLVFDGNCVAFRALLNPCLLLFRWFADDYCASGKIFWLSMLTANRLLKVLSYAPATGIFRWKVSASTRAPVGTIAGARNGRGYRQIRIDGRPYSASRLAWLYMTGKWPNSEISYINGKPSDTRWVNLRQATSSPNRNRSKRK